MTRSIMNEVDSFKNELIFIFFSSIFFSFLSNLFIAPFTHSRHLCARGKKIAVVQL